MYARMETPGRNTRQYVSPDSRHDIRHLDVELPPDVSLARTLYCRNRCVKCFEMRLGSGSSSRRSRGRWTVALHSTSALQQGPRRPSLHEDVCCSQVGSRGDERKPRLRSMYRSIIFPESKPIFVLQRLQWAVGARPSPLHRFLLSNS